MTLTHHCLSQETLTVTQQDWEVLQGHKAYVIWLTGLSGSGKTTLAKALQDQLYSEGKRSFVLDGDSFRRGVSDGLGFSAEDRNENLRRVREVAKLFMDAGVIVICAFVSPFERDRVELRARFGNRLVEVYVKCGIEECRRRDPKGLYKLADKGDVKQFTGVSDTYEPPLAPDLVIDSEQSSAEMATKTLYTYLSEKMR